MFTQPQLRTFAPEFQSVCSLLRYCTCARLFTSTVSVGVPTTVIVQVSVSAPGAAPPAAGKTGNTLKANTAPVTAVNETASVVFGADSASDPPNYSHWIASSTLQNADRLKFFLDPIR